MHLQTMAKGLEHDKAIKLWSLPFGVLISLILDIKTGIIGSLSFLIGGLWLSPDLDIHSEPVKRWGILQLIWIPYRTLIPHRSFFSHGPFIGSALRISYLILIYFVIALIILKFDYKSVFSLSNQFIKLTEHYRKECIVILLGIESSALLHLIKDLNPLSK